MDIIYCTSASKYLTIYKQNNVEQYRKFDYGDYARFEYSNGEEKEMFYIGGGDGLAAVYVKETGESNQLYFTVKDHLNSTWALINESGPTEENYAFNPWGKSVNPTNWEQEDSRTDLILDLGFTGHEHLDELGLINMKARMYDPILDQFISPDPFVLDEGLSINYNRYAYCLNNPLMYTDPTGLWCEFHGSYCTGNCHKPEPGETYYNWDDEQYYTYQGRDEEGNVYGITGDISNVMWDIGASSIPAEDYDRIITHNRLKESAKRYAESLVPIIGKGLFQISVALGTGDVYTVSAQEGRSAVWSQQLYVYSSSYGYSDNEAPNWMGITNNVLGGFGINLGVKSSLMDYAVRKNYKSARTIRDFNKLREGQKKWRRIDTLTKSGAKYLKTTKVLGKVMGGLGGLISGAEILMQGEVRASNVLDLFVTGVSAVPVIGWIAGGSYFVANGITQVVSGQSIGDHLDKKVGKPLYKF